MPEPDVVVKWTRLRAGHPRWNADLCLYAYLHPATKKILYIGKADFQTVRRRLYGFHKAEIFEFFQDAFNLEHWTTIQGGLVLPEGRRRSSALLADVETLLIMRLKPPGNVSATASRTQRPGLRVKCVGYWPHRRTGFLDV